jgi:hypothetical protein
MIDPNNAKRFYAVHLIAQAQKENVILSDTEKWILSYTIFDPVAADANYHLIKFEEKYGENYGETEFVEIMASLLRNAFDDDISHDQSIKVKYQDAYRSLWFDSDKGHFINLIIESSHIREISFFDIIRRFLRRFR